MRFLAPLAILVLSLASPAESAVQDRPWWEVLGDNTLGALIEEALLMSPDLTAAVQRIAQAEASSLRSRAPLLPTLSIDALGSVAP